VPDAILDPTLLADALVGVVDDIRGAVHGALGTRPYRVSVVTRRWSGKRTGEGDYVDSVMLIEPTPQVVRGGSNRFGPGGAEGKNSVTLREVSLRYTEAELYPRDNPANAETVYLLERTFGGGANESQEFFTAENSPTPERGDKSDDRIGWLIKLHEVQDFNPVDRTDA
jgi:hypothetical protein